MNLTQLIEQAILEINKQNLDIKAEVLLAYLIQNGIPKEQLRVLHQGATHRPFTNDIKQASASHDKNTLLVELSRNSIYDMLPEGLIHKQVQEGDTKQVTDLISNYKNRKKESAKARQFFNPFENQLFKILLDLELKEQEVLYQNTAQFESFLKRFWEINEELDEEQCSFMLSILPHCKKIKGDVNEITQTLSLFLNKEILVKKGYTSIKINNKQNNQALILGRNTIIGNESNDLPFVQFIIKDVDEDELRYFIKGGKQHTFIEQFLSYTLPIELEYEISIQPLKTKTSKGFGNLGHSSILELKKN